MIFFHLPPTHSKGWLPTKKSILLVLLLATIAGVLVLSTYTDLGHVSIATNTGRNWVSKMLSQRYLYSNTNGSGVRNGTAVNQGAGAEDTVASKQKESTGVVPANRQVFGAKDTEVANQKGSTRGVPDTKVYSLFTYVL